MVAGQSFKVTNSAGNDGFTIDNSGLSPKFPFASFSVGKAMCWKTGGGLGYCSTTPDAGGACTCN
jgi:hypothetical protein